MQTSDLAGEKLNKIPTALELLRRDENGVCTEHDIVHMMIQFAKIHVTEAVNQITKKVKIDTSIAKDRNYLKHSVRKTSILGAYPLSNIK